MTLLEVCVDSLEGLERARAGGAQRIELCSRLDVGGLSPGLELLSGACSACKLPLHVMIRPREGDFVYSDDEIEAMRAEIERAKGAKVSGVVFGALTRQAAIDRSTTRALAKLARPMSVTFHRAFDAVRDPQAELELLIEIGVDRVLTSGGAASALEGAAKLKRLVDQARGRIVVMPGGGVRAENASEILAATGARELHSSTPFRMKEPSQ
jgi:copper homeostasis protein